MKATLQELEELRVGYVDFSVMSVVCFLSRKSLFYYLYLITAAKKIFLEMSRIVRVMNIISENNENTVVVRFELCI